MAEINEFLSPQAQKQIDKYLQDIKKIATEYNKLGKVSIDLQKQKQAELKTEDLLIKQKQQLERLNQQIAKTDAENLKAQQQLNKVLIEEERIQQQKIKTEQTNIRLSEQKKKVAEKERKETEKLNSAYQQLNEKHKIAIKRAQDLAAEYGRFDKRAVKARREANKYDKELKKIDKSLGRNQRVVASYFQSLVKFAGTLGLVTSASALFRKALDTAKDSILSIQSTGDRFTNTLAGLKEGYNSFIRGVASGNTFKELIQNFRDAVKVGTEYSAILDDLGDLQRSLKIAESETRLEQEKLLTISRDVSRSDEERIKAIDEYIKLENKLVKTRQNNAKQTYAAELLIAKQRSQLSQKEIEDFLKNQEAYIDAVQKRAQVNEEIEESQRSLDLTTEEGRQKQIELLNSLIEVQTEEEKQINKIIENANQLDDAMRDRLVNAFNAVIDAETSSLKSSQRVLTMRNSLIKKINEQNRVQSIDSVKSIGLESIASDEKTERLTSNEDLITDKLKEQLNKRYLANQQYLKNLKQDEINYYESRKELLNGFKDLALDSFNAIYDFQLNAIDNQLEVEDARYQSRKDALISNGESTIELESQYNLRREELERKRAQKEKQQALLNVGISFAEGAFDIIRNALVLQSNPVTAALAPFAWAQLGFLGLAKGAQTASILSAFDEGTDSTPSNYIAGEKRPEFRKHNGQWELLTKPTLFTDSAGDQIISGAETEQILKGASIQATTGNSQIDTDKIVKAIENQPVPNMDKRGMIYIQMKNGSVQKWLDNNVRRN